MPPIAQVTQARAANQVFYIRWDGSDAADGTTTANASTDPVHGAWKTLGHANATLTSGQEVRILSMIPSDTLSALIAPSHNGSPSGWITYTGEVGGVDSAWARYGLNYLTLTNQYISVRGFRFRGGITYDYTNTTNQANFDSVSWSYGVALALHGSHNTVTYGCVFRNSNAGNALEAMGEHGITGPNYPQCSCCNPNQTIVSASMWNTVRKCTFNYPGLSGTSKMVYTHYTWYLTIDSCQFTGTITGSSGDGPAGWYFYNNHNCVIRDSKMTLDNTSGIDQKGFSYRDSTQDMMQLRDTLYLGLSAGSFTSRIANAGNPCQDGQVIRDTVRSSVWIMSNKAYGQELLSNWVIDSTVAVCLANNPPISIENGAQQCDFQFNTLGGHATDLAFGYLFRGSKGNGGIFQNIRFTDNVCYLDSIASGAQEHFSRFTEWGTGNEFDRNLYFFRSHIGSISDPSQYCAGNAQETGGGTVGTTPGGRCFSDGQECNSYYADPKLVSTTLSGAFDAHLKSGSPASTIWHAWNNGSDHVGAYRYVQSIAPAESAYLNVSSSAYVTPAGGGSAVVRRLVIDWYTPTPTAGEPSFTTVTLAAANDGTVPNVPVIAAYVNNHIIGTFAATTPLEGQEFVYYLTEPIGQDVDVYVVLRLGNSAGLYTYSRVGPL